MNAIWPDPKDCDVLGEPISIEGLRARLVDARKRADESEREGYALDAAQTRVFAKLYEDRLNSRLP